MSAQFKIDYPHVKERLTGRYGRHEAEVDGIISRVMNTLHRSTPEDWRFTESPSSRFFVVDEMTEAKFLGMSYRDSKTGREILRRIQEDLENTAGVLESIGAHVDAYLSDVRNPRLPIVHDIRTVYGRGKGAHIAEERRIFESMRSEVAHVLPLAARKIASRPNAIVARDETLWVRQHMNWVSMKEGAREHYLFQPLTEHGIDKGRYAIFSYSENGSLKRVAEKRLDCTVHLGELSEMKSEMAAGDTGIRSESYWKVPTYVDMRLMDLDFAERYSERGVTFTFRELVELYFLRKIVGKARDRLYRN